jgi:hypothetical protein
MPDSSQDLLHRYLRWRRPFEVAYWVVGFLFSATVNSVIALMDVERAHLPFASWQPILWEWSSILVMLALLPAVIAFERRVPLVFSASLRRNLAWHLLASVVFSLVHVLAMVSIRKAVYIAMGQHYDFGPWLRELSYEYIKDVQTYTGILTTVLVYRWFLLRAQGEARLLDLPDEGPPVEEVERPERFLVRKLGKEFLVAASDIEWLQASGNYVNLRVRGHDYPLRTTMAALEPRLDPNRFIRVHRSYMVNLDRVVEIQPLEAGEARLSMTDGSRIPCSRRYRPALRASGQAEPAVPASA